MYVFPKGIRYDRMLPGGGDPEAGVSGDPTKSTPEIGRIIIEFKVNAGLTQYQALKSPARGCRGG
ncbi:MAG: hypothetical protein HY701_06395 [Gemmatimonadetes bacterium]|nr:hypothetical protein [Gemmatimonadota bacterium]